MFTQIMLSLTLSFFYTWIVSLYTNKLNVSKNVFIKLLLMFIGVIMICKLANFPIEFSVSGLMLFLSLSILLIMMFIDFEMMILPDTLNTILFVIIVLGKYFHWSDFDLISIKSSLMGFLFGGGSFLIIAILTNGSMGGGDIKLMAILGLWIGAIDIWVISLFAFVIGAGLSVLLLASKLKKRKDPIPFGPFIIISAFVVLFYGNEIKDWYLSIIM